MLGVGGLGLSDQGSGSGFRSRSAAASGRYDGVSHYTPYQKGLGSEGAMSPVLAIL